MEQAYVQEYLTSNEFVAYPFKEDAQGLLQKDGTPVHGAAAMLPRDFLLDMVVTVPALHQDQLYLKSISRSGSTYLFTFGAAATSLGAWSLASVPAERSVVSFQTILDRIIIRMVTGSSFASYLAAMADPSTDEFQARLPLETAVVEFTPHKLLDLLLGVEELPGEVLIYEGYNIELGSTAADPATSTPSRLTITAGPGLGAGRHNPCDSPVAVDYVGRINGQTADKNGNLLLDGDECYRVLSDQGGHRLQLVNDCIPCCSCDDYANMVKAIANHYTQLAAVLASIDGSVVLVNSDVTDWNTVLVPKLFKLTVDIYVTRGNQTGLFLSTDPKVSSGKSPNFASIVVVVKNPDNKVVSGVTVAVTGIMQTVLQTVYFDSTGQHLSGTNTSFTPGTIPANSYFKPIILVKDAYPSAVSGTFTATVSVGGIPVVSKSVTVS